MMLEVIGSGSKGNCYILRNKTEALILECGVRFDVVKKSFGYDLTKVCGIIITHEHKDHCKGVPEALASGLNVYATKGTADAMNIKSHRLICVEEKKIFAVGRFKVIAFKVMHDAAQPVGYVIQHEETGNILFITDTYYVPNRFDNIHNILIEANYCEDIINEKLRAGKKFLRDRVIQSHMSIKTCKELLAANDLTKVNNIVLIHLSDSNSDARRFRQEIANQTGCNVSIAENGMMIPFDKTPF